MVLVEFPLGTSPIDHTFLCYESVLDCLINCTDTSFWPWSHLASPCLRTRIQLTYFIFFPPFELFLLHSPWAEFIFTLDSRNVKGGTALVHNISLPCTKMVCRQKNTKSPKDTRLLRSGKMNNMETPHGTRPRVLVIRECQSPSVIILTLLSRQCSPMVMWWGYDGWIWLCYDV